MTKDEARQLFAYGCWANSLMFSAIEALPPEQRSSAIASSFPSVLRTLSHIVAAEWIWLHRWLGESLPAPAWAAQPDLLELRQQAARVEKDRAAFLATLSDADLGRVVAYRNLAGQEYTNLLSDLVRHVANHSTYHRGQLATQLRQLGHTPPTTDFVAYVRLAR